MGVSLWLIGSAGVWAGDWFRGFTSRHYCADSASKQISNVQTRAPKDVIYSRWQEPYWDVFASLFYSLWKRPTKPSRCEECLCGKIGQTHTWAMHIYIYIYTRSVYIYLEEWFRFSKCILVALYMSFSMQLSETTKHKYRSLIKNTNFRRIFQMALRGFCIWTLQYIYSILQVHFKYLAFKDRY